jgi:hypothetical protein
MLNNLNIGDSVFLIRKRRNSSKKLSFTDDSGNVWTRWDKPPISYYIDKIILVAATNTIVKGDLLIAGPAYSVFYFKDKDDEIIEIDSDDDNLLFYSIEQAQTKLDYLNAQTLAV